MSPLVFKFGTIEIHAFTAWLGLGVALSAAIVLGIAARDKQRLMPWLDTIVGTVVGSAIGARIGHVALSWAYFSIHQNEIASFSSGGLDWHGALLGGLIGAILVATIRHVPILKLLDVATFAIPIGAIAIWLACAAVNSAYGVEVRTLADYPAWLVIESPDVYGQVAPRINLAPIGIALAVLVLVLVVALTALRWLSGLRFWLALIIYALGMAVIDFFRAEYVPTILDHRADQVLDLAVALFAVLMFAIVAIVQLRRRKHLSNLTLTSTPIVVIG